MHNEAGDSQAVNVLLVEDNDIDAEAVTRAFKRASIPNIMLCRAIDGVEALEMLCNTHTQGDLRWRSVILLDINMPRMDGFTFLDRLRKHALLKHMVVFMLTTSGREGDRALAYSHNVAGYFLKENLASFVEMLGSYFKGNQFPVA